MVNADRYRNAVVEIDRRYGLQRLFGRRQFLAASLAIGENVGRII